MVACVCLPLDTLVARLRCVGTVCFPGLFFVWWNKTRVRIRMFKSTKRMKNSKKDQSASMLVW